MVWRVILHLKLLRLFATFAAFNFKKRTFVESHIKTLIRDIFWHRACVYANRTNRHAAWLGIQEARLAARFASTNVLTNIGYVEIDSDPPALAYVQLKACSLSMHVVQISAKEVNWDRGAEFDWRMERIEFRESRVAYKHGFQNLTSILMWVMKRDSDCSSPHDRFHYTIRLIRF
jgi:hypothetical protein